MPTRAFYLLTVLGLLIVLSCLAPHGATAGTAEDLTAAADLYNQGDYLRAIGLLNQVVARDTAYRAAALYQLGRCYLAQAMLDDAISVFKQGLQQASLPADRETVIQTRKLLIESCLQARLWQDAAEVLQSFLVDRPEEGGRLLCEYYGERKEFEQAIAVLGDLIARYPQSERKLQYKIILVKVLLKTGKRADAIAHLKGVREEVMADSGSCRHVDKLDLGLLTFHDCDQVKEAREYFNFLLKHDQTVETGFVKLQLAYCTYIERDYALARAQFSQLYETCDEPSVRASALYKVGDCSERLGDLSQAISAFEDVVKQYPDNELSKMAAERLQKLGVQSKSVPASKSVAQASTASAQR